MLRRLGAPALIAILILSTGVAFAITERLKLQKWPIIRTDVTRTFSPACRCETGRAEISFTLRKSDKVTIEVLGRDEKEVRRLLDDERRQPGNLRIAWDGRDESGSVVPDGTYRVRVHLAGARRTIVLPNLIRLDTTPPEVTLVNAEPRTISPDGDRRADALHIRFKLSEKGRALLYVDGRPVARARLKTRKIDWHGKIGQQLSLGEHELTLRALDMAGNLSGPTAPFTAEVRILELLPQRIGVGIGREFTVTISTERRRVRWRFAGNSALFRGKRLTMIAPTEPGEYWLLLSSGPYKAGARVFVFRP